ncbi:MAG: N-acetyltransferase family protein [Desulfovibrio sp.]
MNDEFCVSLFVPEDAPGISRFYREMYGDNFPMRYVYDPAEIVRRYDGVNHRTAVVHDTNGELAAVGSLFRSAPNPLLYEAGQLMVTREHRGKGLASLLRRVVLEEYPTQIPVDALFLEALCSHTISQHNVSSGFAPTGVELEWLPAITSPGHPGRDEGAHNRISLLTLFRVFKDTPQVIHPHPAHTGYIGQCVRSLGLERTVGPGALPDVETTACETDILPDASIATLSVFRIGKDWPEALARFEAGAMGYALHVRVNLGDAAAPWAMDILRGQGFFLSAYLPLWFGTDGMLCQKLPSAPDFSAPRYGSDAARQLAEAIRADYEAVAAKV